MSELDAMEAMLGMEWIGAIRLAQHWLPVVLPCLAITIIMIVTGTLLIAPNHRARRGQRP